MTHSHSNRNKGINPVSGNVIWDSATPNKRTATYSRNGETVTVKRHTNGGNGVHSGRLNYVGVGQYSQRASHQNGAAMVHAQRTRQAASRQRFEVDGY